MIYGINGTPMGTAYDIDGETLNQAYDIDGNPVLTPLPTSNLVVMSYNYQWCIKLNSQLAMQQAIINKYDADIIGLQEACTQSDVQNKVEVGSFPSIANTFLSNYPNKILSTEATNKNAIASKLELSNYQNIQYTQSDDETWDYQKCYITLPNGITVAWYNTHLTWRDDQATLLRKYSQMAELFNDAKNEPYAILTGDFNYYGLSASGAEYEGMYKPFADAGFKFANVNVGVSPTMTFTTKTNATSLADLSTCPDNIIVSSNINILDVEYDTTKFSYLNGQPIDHIAMIAHLEIS